MKKSYIFVLSILSFIIIAFTGCSGGVTRLSPYHFGVKYNLNTCEVLVTFDKEDEKFIFEYTDKDSKAELYFDVNFTYHTIITLSNSPEFDYTDKDGNELIFDENGYYVCNGDQIFYISYKNANAEIKEAISKGEFNISFGFGIFVLKAYEMPNFENEKN